MFHGCFQVFPTFSRILGSVFFFSPRVFFFSGLGICRFNFMNFLGSQHHTESASPAAENCIKIATSIWIAITSSLNYVKTIPCGKNIVSKCPKLDARPFWGRIHDFYSRFGILKTISIKYATLTVSTYDMLDFGIIYTYLYYNMYGTTSTWGSQSSYGMVALAGAAPAALAKQGKKLGHSKCSPAIVRSG